MVSLRALEPEDIDFLYELENDKALWEISETQAPFSRYLLREFISNAHLDIYQTKQLRLVIVSEGQVVGCADLYDFNPKNKRISVGIVILSSYRNRGIGAKALFQVCQYAFTFLAIHQVIAYVPEDNVPSQKLFEKIGFVREAVLKDWIFSQGIFKNIFLYHYVK